MSLSDEVFKRKLEEFKELGQEYRYRDQLMVQEFSLSMIAIGVLLNLILKDPSTTTQSLLLQVFGMCFSTLLSLHIRSINIVRLAALDRKETLYEQLEFVAVHRNRGERIRISAPKWMIRFSFAVTLAWWCWTGISALERYFAHA